MKKILIVGAGPVGLSAAFFISRIPNIHITIVEKKIEKEHNVLSKALNVNARTMSIFHNTNIQTKIIERSYKVKGMRLYNGNNLVFENNVTSYLKSISPFSSMFIHPQT
eukprot:GHVR01055237.1.p1 GENE.GHVR01055237.1~~GHVR01055237.1.p1  ORF type:complete len:109 (-),score=14.61 GHVR01055237.1:1060-1386(-)